MTHSINNIRSQLTGGGARPSLFRVVISNPFDPAADIKVPFMVRATNVPSYSIGKIEIPYFGRKIPIPGDRVWEDWNTTVMNDEDHIVKNSLELWHSRMNAFEGNIAQDGSSPNNYKSQATVTQFGKDGSELRIYQINGIFPLYIAPVELDWSSTDTVEEFAVTWAYDNMVVVGGITGDGGSDT